MESFDRHWTRWTIQDRMDNSCVVFICFCDLRNQKPVQLVIFLKCQQPILRVWILLAGPHENKEIVRLRLQAACPENDRELDVRHMARNWLNWGVAHLQSMFHLHHLQPNVVRFQPFGSPFEVLELQKRLESEQERGESGWAGQSNHWVVGYHQSRHIKTEIDG